MKHVYGDVCHGFERLIQPNHHQTTPSHEEGQQLIDLVSIPSPNQVIQQFILREEYHERFPEWHVIHESGLKGGAEMAMGSTKMESACAAGDDCSDFVYNLVSSLTLP